jgi:hypothetical protein
MATGGIFTIITNDGKQDRMLMASELLRTRLAAITTARRGNASISDSTPTLLDIEKTHILFTNAHFKPFAAIGFEYSKTTATSGSLTLGGDVTFSIPQFGDFFHDMLVYVKLQQPRLVPTADAVSDQPLMRWCSYPGERIFESVAFDVNGNVLDTYHDHSVNMHREFNVQPNKALGWDRCVGQEEEEEGFVDQPNWKSSGVAPSAISYRTQVKSFSGDQTPTGQKDEAVYKELLVPLLFWCNKDVRLSVPSVAIPYGQRFIRVKLADGTKLVNLVPRGANAGKWGDADIGGSLDYTGMLKTIELYINNIFVNPEVHDIFIRRIGFTLIRVHRQQVVPVNQDTGSFLLNQMKWPIETMFVGMKVNSYNSDNTALKRQNLDKWHTFSQVTEEVRSSQGWLQSQATLGVASTTVASQFNNGAADPTVTPLTLTALAVGVTTYGLVANDTVTVVTAAGPVTLTVASFVEGEAAVVAVITFKQTVQFIVDKFGLELTQVAAGANLSTVALTPSEVTTSVRKCTKTLDKVTIVAHGIKIYDQFSSQFYNAYIPYHYGGPNVSTPKDCSALMIPFNLYPGTYQPSGHINVSRAREFYIDVTSSVINNVTTGQLVVVASAINFLLISDGSAVLRYTT